MFSCLTQDPRVFGVNEDAFGSTLHRLVTSEQEMGKCPHSLDAFKRFMVALRGNRETLILKTPSNIRHIKLIQRHFPSSRFILMVREPHAAIASGVARHQQGTPIDDNARLWQESYQLHTELEHISLIVNYEHLVNQPLEAIQAASQAIRPFSDEVTAYARRMHDPHRAGKDRWRTKVNAEQADEIERCIESRKLDQIYQSLLDHERSSLRLSGDSIAKELTEVREGLIGNLRRQFFRAWYQVKK